MSAAPSLAKLVPIEVLEAVQKHVRGVTVRVPRRKPSEHSKARSAREKKILSTYGRTGSIRETARLLRCGRETVSRVIRERTA